jgi:hypothetical protein
MEYFLLYPLLSFEGIHGDALSEEASLGYVVGSRTSDSKKIAQTDEWNLG